MNIAYFSRSLTLSLLGSCVLITACSSAKEQLGLERKSPNEFAVIKRAPLSMPPDYTLRPPAPGIARPQEQAADSQAREALIGASETTPEQTTAEALLLQKAGADNADPSIRETVDKETYIEDKSKKPVAERLLGVALGDDKPASKVVDAKAEKIRIEKNLEEGRPITEGETKSYED